ncbi:MAG: sensor domain-containing diguanylate cyclase [Clostridiaceae bacterium]|nr:sensor domain-containing diguanylate cyclase [Clostridiaceae bacterium]
MEPIKKTMRTGMFDNFRRYDGNTARFGWIFSLGLLLIDVFSRLHRYNQKIDISIVLVQILLGVLYFAATQRKHKLLIGQTEIPEQYKIAKTLEILFITSFISTLNFSEYLYFITLLPVTLESISRGFNNAKRYLFLGLFSQISTQFIMTLWHNHTYNEANSFIIQLLVIVCEYVIIWAFVYLCGTIYNEYMRSEEENKVLIDKLGDKYVQLEQAKKEIQENYEKMRKTYEKLEETNEKLTSSIAEFYTLQQISQAITSIFNVNELLKFVNDVILGVMGAYHSTIALCYGQHNKLKVQVSSISDKKELAIVSDYLNSDVLYPCIREGHSMIDNDVDPGYYPFTKGRNIKSLICVPFLAKGNPLGIVLIEHSIRNAFNNENVRLLEIICQQVSIAIENARLYQQMHDLATMDGLTGAYNRLYFQDKLEEEFKKAKTAGYDLSLIIFDIDHFKKFNDTYGHLFGDKVLRNISVFISKNLRKEDVFARYGGEEFVILMPHTTLQQAKEKADDLRKGVAELLITDQIVTASVNISLGVSSFPVTAGSPNELMKTADDALYEAKKRGRNIVCVAKARV